MSTTNNAISPYYVKTRFWLWTGPTAVRHYVDLFRRAGLIDIVEGTEKVIATVIFPIWDRSVRSVVESIVGFQTTSATLSVITQTGATEQEYKDFSGLKF